MVMKRGICECLAGLAAVAAARNRYAQAVKLLAAAETHLTSSGAAWWPADQGEVERTRKRLRDSLGEPAFTQIWEEGQGLDLEEAIAGANTLPDSQF